MSKSVVKTIDIKEPASAPMRDPVLSMLEGVVNNTGASIERVEQAFAFYQKVEADRARKEFDRAFMLMHPDLPVVEKNGTISKNEKDQNGQKTGKQEKMAKYARFEDIFAAIAPVLQTNGFVVSFRTAQPSGDRVAVTCVLAHREGHREETTLALPLDTSGAKNNVQGWGSAVQYGKRYTMCALLNIVTRGDDDDGNAAGSKPEDKDALIAEVKRLAHLKRVTETAVLERFSVGDFADLTLKQLNSAIAGLNKTAVQS